MNLTDHRIGNFICERVSDPGLGVFEPAQFWFRLRLTERVFYEWITALCVCLLIGPDPVKQLSNSYSNDTAVPCPVRPRPEPESLAHHIADLQVCLVIAIGCGFHSPRLGAMQRQCHRVDQPPINRAVDTFRRE